MKKLLFSLFVMMLSLSSYSQIKSVCIGFGYSYFDYDVLDASNSGMNCCISVGHFYFDGAGNFGSGGKGEYLNFHSSYTRQANKKSVSVVNLGYIIFHKNFSIIPIVGWADSQKIYEDNLAFDTYYQVKDYSGVNIGCIVKYRIKSVNIFCGVGTFERFKVGLDIDFAQLGYN